MRQKSQATKRQKELLRAIYSSLKNAGYPPSFEDLKNKFEIKSNQAIIDHLMSLEKKGLITRGEKSARTIKIKPLGYKILGVRPLAQFLGTSSAGDFIKSEEITGEWKEISKDVKKLDEKVYIIRVNGDSMVNVGIDDGDTLLVQEQEEFKSGDIVVANTPNGTTVKRFISQDSPPYLFLKPENPKYKIIHFTEEITLQGKIIGKLVSGEWQQLTQGRFL